MIKTLLFILFIALFGVLYWYFADFFLWLDFLIHPYTPIGKQISIFVVHALFVGFAGWSAFIGTTVTNSMRKHKK